MIKVDVSVKNQLNTTYTKKIMPGILAYVLAIVTKIVT